MRNLDEVIKAYDVRGIYPEQFDEALARDVGAAAVEVLGVRRADGGVGTFVVGHDMRPSAEALVPAFVEGVRSQGVDVVTIGLCSTDGLYFASGSLDCPGAMFTASHNPARYNGIKLCRAGAAPVGADTGLAAIARLIADNAIPVYSGPTGGERHQDVLADYANYLHKLVPLEGVRPLRVVVDAGNGMAGLTAPSVLGTLPLEVVDLYFDLDGTFPNHEANPIEPANLVDAQQAVVAHRADLGLVFDGDADRCFVIDERGQAVDPSTITAMIAAAELQREPGATIIHNLITSRAVPEIVRDNGGVPVRTRVGHSFIKATMAETGAIFGGEHSGHFYFRDFWKADSGMLAALHVLATLGHSPPGTALSVLTEQFSRYCMSGEINTTVSDIPAAMAAVRAELVQASDQPVQMDELDGLTIQGSDWWVNVRPSNTEPLLRLNVEAPSQSEMSHLRDQALAIIGRFAAE